MKRMMSRKSHSWWWDSHISPKNSKWLAENLEEMDKRVKDMLKLIEEEGDSFAKKAEMYYQRRPQLVSHVEDFYRMYRALAERYDNVTGELRKNIPSELRSQGSGNGSDLNSEPPSPSLHSPERTPESRRCHIKPGSRAAGFGVFLGSGGSSDLSSRKGSDGSSSSDSSESDTESEDAKEANGHDLSEGLNQRIVELENELHDVKEKLREYEEKGFNGKCEHEENGDIEKYRSRISALDEELAVANKRIRVSDSLIATLRQKLAEGNSSLDAEHAELNQEKQQVAEMEERITVLESEIADHKCVIDKLKGALVEANVRLEAELSNRDHQIEGYKAELANASERFLQVKSGLEANVSHLEAVVEELKSEVKKISGEKSALEAHVSEQENVIEQLKATAASAVESFLREKAALTAEIHGLSQSYVSLEEKLSEKTEAFSENEKRIDGLNKSIYELEAKAETLKSDKEKFEAEVSVLIQVVTHRNASIDELNKHMHELHLEQVKLIKEVEEVQRDRIELRKRVKELEEEVDKQKVAILDSAEGKREAIRQLCFSLEHYRDGYKQLRLAMQGRKQLTVAVV